MDNQSNTIDNGLRNVGDIMREIEEKSASGDYLYRGEPEHYGKISSNLYRQYVEIEADDFDIDVVQKEIVAEAEPYSHETDDRVEILTQLQHHGGKTNLIDFTNDYLIALFFACDSSDSIKKDGRLILLEKDEEQKDLILLPRNPRNRVIAQKSVFVQHPDGFFSPDDVDIITIPAYLKQPLLAHLRKYHGISTETIYNDLHGFIKNQSIHESAYTEFHRGLTYQLRGDEADTAVEKRAAYTKAITYYTRALELKPDLPEAHTNRGNVYRETGEFDKAIEDYNSAIDYNPDDANAYNNRGNAYFDKNEFDKAIEDYNSATELKTDYDDAYYNRGSAYLIKGNLKLAFQNFNKAIELNPDNAEVYVIRGDTYLEKSDFDLALQDFNKAIELNPDNAEAYVIRGSTWLHQQEWEKAKTDLTIARDMGVDISASFSNDYGSIANFEKENDVKLPEDIAAMLTSER